MQGLQVNWCVEMSEAVSVIITCYNLEEYITQAIASVKRQDYCGTIQIVVVDDASTDNSRSLLEKEAGIQIVHQPTNGGVLKAILSGFAAAQHDVIFFLDGDDVWHREKVSRCMELFRADVQFVTHDLNYMSKSGQYLERTTRVSEVLGRKKPAYLDNIIRDGILRHDDFIWLGSAFGIRKSLSSLDGFVQHCADFGYTSSCYQDWPIAVWVALQKRGSMSYVNEKLFDYRIHDNNYSGSTQTVEKLQRNLRKSFHTMLLIESIIEHFGGHLEVRKSHRDMKRAYSLQLTAAAGSRSEIASELVRTGFGILLSGNGAKPLIRAVLSFVLGNKLAYKVLERYKEGVWRVSRL